MPDFKPFIGTRYNEEIDPNLVIAPPYDVVDSKERAELSGRHRANSIKVELPDANDGDIEGDFDNYEYAHRLLESWIKEGILLNDPEPSFYVYKMTFAPEANAAESEPISTIGVLGALKIEEPGTGDVLPHENTIKKAKTDRLDLLTATKTNISPIWGLSLATGLSELIISEAHHSVSARDDDGVLHELWVISQADKIAEISEKINGEKILIADGHHRYETSWNYRNEVRSTNGDKPGDHDYVMTYVVELNPKQIHLQAIHRLIRTEVPIQQVLSGLENNYRIFKYDGLEEDMLKTISLNREAGIYTQQGMWLMSPNQNLKDSSNSDLETKWLEIALNEIPGLEVSYQHGFKNVLNLISNQEAEMAIFVNPVSIDQIKASSEARFRMPPKSTFFTPKPRTGLVFRRLLDELN